MHVLLAESEKHTVVCDIEEMDTAKASTGLSAAAARARRYARRTGWLQALAGTAARHGSSRESESRWPARPARLPSPTIRYSQYVSRQVRHLHDTQA